VLVPSSGSGGYEEPPEVGDEAATLMGSLERQRATFAWKCADLDRAALNARVGASELTLARLLKHLAYMEDINFTRELAGEPLPEPWSSVADAPDDPRSEWVFRSADDDAAEDLYRLWEAAVDRSRGATRRALTAGGPGSTYLEGGSREISLRRLLVDMIEEYARHTGHADLIREAVDGRVGEDPPGRARPYPSG
jgi:uncharacterized damage-inducible protein DinB